MRTEVEHVFIDNGSESMKKEKIQTHDGHLMRSRLKTLVRDHPNKVHANQTLGNELLAHARNLFQTYVAMQDINRTTESEVCYVRKKIKQDEALYKDLFGNLPDSYREIVKLP